MFLELRCFAYRITHKYTQLLVQFGYDYQQKTVQISYSLFLSFITTSFETGVLLFSATLLIDTSTLASGK